MALSAKLSLSFLLGQGASADQVGDVLGAFTNESPRYL
jgi:hypothetical protein